MKEPLAVYDEIQWLLRKNGFHLQKDRLVQSEQPHILGIFWEMGSKFFGSIFALYYAVLFISSYQAEMWSGASASSLVWPGIMALLFAGIYAFFIYMDLRRRQYDIYDDAVEYKEGFLTKYDSIIPMENVSDVENTQSFFSKILGLHDIKISCQGSGNDVLFKNMAHGEQMIENIKYLKDAIIPKEKPKIVSKKESVVWYTDKIDEPLKYDEAFTGEYKMHMLRTLLPFLVFLIPPMTAVGFFLIISQIPRVLFTTFSITQSSIDKRFQFLSNKYTSYSIEKITWVVIRESLIDKMFWTCTVSFLSIGSSGDMNYHNIKKTPELEKNILQKVGIYTDGDKTKIETHFSFMEYLKANIGYGVLAMVLLMIGLVFQSISFAITDTELQEMILALSYLLFVLLWMWVVFFLPFFIYKKIFYGEKFYQNSTFSDGVMSKKWIIFQAKYYALYRNIKGITSVKFPLTETGKLLFNVSGEKFVQSKKQNKLSKKPAGVMVSNTIQIPYTLQVQQTHFDFDEVLEGQKIDTNKVLESSQDIWNSIVVPLMCIVLFVLVTFWASVPIWLVLSIVWASIIWLIIWSIKVKYYDLEKSRIVAGSGIIYKKRQSILYSKFNFIELGRGFFNKIFKNGNISIYTLWSGKKEMSIQDTEDYQEIYDMLQVH